MQLTLFGCYSDNICAYCKLHNCGVTVKQMKKTVLTKAVLPSAKERGSPNLETERTYKGTSKSTQGFDIFLKTIYEVALICCNRLPYLLF